MKKKTQFKTTKWQKYLGIVKSIETMSKWMGVGCGHYIYYRQLRKLNYKRQHATLAGTLQ